MRAVFTLFIVALSACAAKDDADVEGARSLEQWALSPEPTVSIGVVEGDEPYQLHGASSSVRLPDGRIAVVNGGSDEVRFFGENGEFLGSFGGDGDGPGEFRDPSRIRYLRGDTLQVWDQRKRRYSLHDGSGAFIEVRRLESDEMEPFPADVWVYGGNLIDSPVRPEKRGGLVPGLMALPEIDDLVVARQVIVTEQGRLWTTDLPIQRDSSITWHVYELDGTDRAFVRLPARFEPHQIGPDFILGRWSDDLDVNYIRMYALQKPAGSTVGPGLTGIRSAPDRPVTFVYEDVGDEVWPGLTSLPKQMASLQEINYSRNMTYTDDFAALGVDPPDDVRIGFLNAGPRGWTGIFTHLPTGAFCTLTYGRPAPMGWHQGRVICPGS
ncbi:MAG: hypothetical protein IH968_06195 [Gemmatimonadetes bacterium]|nr:hypothetical protein [Gemmatimonadota bacterium]